MLPQNQSPKPAPSSASSPGIIDTVGRGFALLNRRPYLIWLPIVVDVLLWSGLRLSTIDPLATLSARMEETWPVVSELSAQVRDAVAGTDLIGIAVWPVPTLVSALGRRTVPILGGEQAVTVSDSLALIALPGAIVLALVLGVSYLTVIGRLISNQPAWGTRFIRDCLLNSVRVGGVFLAILALAGFLLVPFLMVGWGLQQYGIEPAGLLITVVAIYVAWLFLFFIFSPHAVALGSASPLMAMRASFQVVQRNVLSVIGLLIIVILIRVGTPLALRVFTENPWSVPFAIVVNAYVVTALIAATMLYYRDRSAGQSIAQQTPEPAPAH